MLREPQTGEETGRAMHRPCRTPVPLWAGILGPRNPETGRAWVGSGGTGAWRQHAGEPWEETEKGLESPPLSHLSLPTVQLLAVRKARIVAMGLCQRFH